MSITTGSLPADAVRLGACTASWTLLLLVAGYQALEVPELQQMELNDRTRAILAGASYFPTQKANRPVSGLAHFAYMTRARLWH